MTVKVIKISSGEVLIAKVVSVADGLVKIKSVARIVEVAQTNSQAGTDEMNVVMMPFMPFTKASIETDLGGDQIVFMVDPIEEIEAKYSEAFSGIVKPKSKGLILPQ